MDGASANRKGPPGHPHDSSFRSPRLNTYLDLIFHLPCKVLNDERRLHDGGAEEVPVVFMLLFEFGQQGLARGVGEAGGRIRNH